MLLFNREQFHLYFILVYLQGGQSIFKRRAAPTDRFQLHKTASRSAARILFVLTAPEGQRKGHCQSRSEGHRALQRQQFYLGVKAQKICADDNIKGVGVQHFAVLRYLLVAEAHGDINPPQGMDGSTIPKRNGHGFGFLYLDLFQQSAGHH